MVAGNVLCVIKTTVYLNVQWGLPFEKVCRVSSACLDLITSGVEVPHNNGEYCQSNEFPVFQNHLATVKQA